MSGTELILGALALLNVCTFALFGWDKRCAGRQRRRVPEARLLGLSLLGGWVGGWIAMSLFRHKTQKTSFKLKMAAATAVWVAGGALYLFR